MAKRLASNSMLQATPAKRFPQTGRSFEQFGVRSRADKIEQVSLNPVDQKKVAADVAFAVIRTMSETVSPNSASTSLALSFSFSSMRARTKAVIANLLAIM